MRVSVFGSQLEHLCVRRFGLVESPRPEQHVSEVVARVCVARRGGQRAAHQIDRAIAVTALKASQAEEVQRVGVLGRLGQHALEELFGRIDVTGAENLQRQPQRRWDGERVRGR